MAESVEERNKRIEMMAMGLQDAYKQARKDQKNKGAKPKARPKARKAPPKAVPWDDPAMGGEPTPSIP